MLLTLDCETLSHFLPCMCDPMRRTRLSCRLGFEKPKWYTTLLFPTLMARSHLYGIVCIAICHWIFQVCKIFIQFQKKKKNSQTRNDDVIKIHLFINT